MSHYHIEQWADFVRGLLSGNERGKMREHLASGCAECNATVRFLTRVTETAANERFYDAPSREPADQAIRAFGPSGASALIAARIGRALRTIVAALTYDSAVDYQIAGARSNSSPARHLLYEADPYVVDLRVETDGENATATATGQVVNRTSPESHLVGLPVFLMAGSRIVGESESNRVGEFIIEFRPERNLRLYIPVAGAGEQIEISLEQLDD